MTTAPSIVSEEQRLDDMVFRVTRMRRCQFCGEPFRQNRPCKPQRFCSHSCWASTRTGKNSPNWKDGIEQLCEHCGKSYRAHGIGTREKRQYCSRVCADEAKVTHWRWRTPHTDANGYRVISWQGGPRYVHRLVVEESIGRQLSTDEHVHHIDGDRENNELSNLQVMSHSEHSRLHILDRLAGRGVA